MTKSAIVALVAILAICNFCNEEFLSLGRHTWRCKQRPVASAGANRMQPCATLPIIERASTQKNADYVNCVCGKRCKGLRGLKSHLRSCKSVNVNPHESLEDACEAANQNSDCVEITESFIDQSNPNMKVSLIWFKNGRYVSKTDKAKDIHK